MRGRKLFMLLLRIQGRRRLNQLRGSRPRLGFLALGLIIFSLAFSGTHLVMWTYIQRLTDAEQVRQALLAFDPKNLDPLRFTRYEDVADQGARLMIVFLSCSLVSALFLKWGHWQSAERDADWEWFADQALSPLVLFINRCLAESFWPQGLALFTLPFFSMLAFSRGVPLLTAFALSALLLLCMQALLAAPRLAFDLWLRLHWQAHEVRTLRGVIGVLGAGLLILAMQSLSMEQSWAIKIVLQLHEAWDKTPAALALSTLLLRDHSTGLQNFFWLLMAIIGVHLCCYLWAASAFRRISRGTTGWSTSRNRKMRGRGGLALSMWHRLHPLTRRDLCLLKRDRHFLLQIVLGPFLLAIIPLEMFSEMWLGQSPALLMSVAFIGGLLFLMGAVFQLLEMEGQSLWMLFTWPESLAHIIFRRLQIFVGLATSYAMLILMLGIVRQGVSLQHEVWRIIYMIWGFCCLAIILAALAVLAYKPGGEKRENRPGWLATSGILILGGLYNSFMFRPGWIQSFLMMLLLAGLAFALWLHMKIALPRLLDLHAPR